MSLHISLVAIEGSWIDRLTQFFEGQEYTIHAIETGDTKTAANRLDRQPSDRLRVVKAACVAGGWTLLVDPEMVLAADTESLGNLAKSLSARVCSAFCDGGSGSYLFYAFSPDGANIRAVEEFDNALPSRNEGEPAPGEPAIGNSVSEDEIMALLACRGIVYDGFQQAREYTIYTLGEEAMGSATSSPPTPAKQADSKPWWKFW